MWILSGSIIVGAIIPQVEVTFVMTAQTPGKESSGGDLESVIPDSSSIAEEIINGCSTSMWQNARADFTSRRMNTSCDVGTPQSEVSSMVSIAELGNRSTNNANVQVAQVQNVTFKQIINDRDDLQSSPDKSTSSATATPKSIYEERPAKLVHSDSTISNTFIANNFNLSSMKKGFSSFMTSIDSALKMSPEDGNSDTISMRSDVSSDSENYIMISLEDQEKIDAAFSLDPTPRVVPVEEASEVVEETPDTQSEKSMDSTCKRKDLVSWSILFCLAGWWFFYHLFQVSLVTLKLSKVEFGHQSYGFSSTVKVQICNVSSEECSSIPWDEFQVIIKSLLWITCYMVLSNCSIFRQSSALVEEHGWNNLLKRTADIGWNWGSITASETKKTWEKLHRLLRILLAITKQPTIIVSQALEKISTSETRKP